MSTATMPDLATATVEDLRRIADFGPDALELFDQDVADYNDGNLMGINQLADLFGVGKATIYAWIPKENAPQPSTEYMPDPDQVVVDTPADGDGKPIVHRFWLPETVIPWGIRNGKLDWAGPRKGWVRRYFTRLRSPGRARRAA